jgi:hypothetical protein
MVTIINMLIELAVSGLFTALFLLLFVKLGWMPMMVLQFKDKEDEESEKDDLPY